MTSVLDVKLLFCPCCVFNSNENKPLVYSSHFTTNQLHPCHPRWPQCPCSGLNPQPHTHADAHSNQVAQTQTHEALVTLSDFGQLKALKTTAAAGTERGWMISAQ